jgi:hypothetical protein
MACGIPKNNADQSQLTTIDRNVEIENISERKNLDVEMLDNNSVTSTEEESLNVVKSVDETPKNVLLVPVL